MTKTPPEWTIEYSDQVTDRMDENEEMAAAIREATSRMRQVMQEFEAGKFKSVEEALRSIGMEPVDYDDVPDEVKAIAEKDE